MRLKCQFESCCNGRCCGRIWWRLAFWHNFQWILSTTTGSDSGDPNSTGPEDSCKKFWPIKRQLETVSTNHRTVAVPLWMHLCKMSLLLNLVGANKRVMRSTRMVGGGLWYENKKKPKTKNLDLCQSSLIFEYPSFKSRNISLNKIGRPSLKGELGLRPTFSFFPCKKKVTVERFFWLLSLSDPAAFFCCHEEKRVWCGAGGWNGCARLAAALSTATADYNAILHMVAMRMMIMIMVIMVVMMVTAKVMMVWRWNETFLNFFPVKRDRVSF